MNEQRDSFLTEAIGECWHDNDPEKDPTLNNWPKFFWPKNNDFSTWEGFGKLFEWAATQEWWKPGFLKKHDYQYWRMQERLIHPDRFADAIYELLKGDNDENNN